MYPFSAVINAHSLGAVCGSTADATRRNRSAATLVTFRHLRSAADLPHSCTRTPFKTVTYAVLARLRFSIFLSLPLSLSRQRLTVTFPTLEEGQVCYPQVYEGKGQLFASS